MCLPIEELLYLSNESLNSIGEENLDDLDWPFWDYSPSVRMIACSRCYCPVTFSDSVICNIYNDLDQIIGLVVPVIDLFYEVRLSHEDFIEQWRTRVYCTRCNFILSISDEFVRPELDNGFHGNLFSFRSHDVQVVILVPYFIIEETVEEIRLLNDEVLEIAPL